MCKGDKKCKACAAASIGKTMAKTRKSKKGLIEQGLYITGGLVVGGYAVPKIVETANLNLDNKIIQGITAAGGFFGAMNTKGAVSNMLLGVGVGAAASLLSEVVGLGYVVSPSYDLNRIIGASNNYSGTTGLNPGDI